MEKALLFFLAVLLVVAIVYTRPKKEGFTTLMGVNWTSMNEGTPVACYSSLPIRQPKVVNIAEAGVGNIQPSPPPASDLPTAPAGLRSKETPNPYIDPSLEPAKYIRILGVKENLQAFFGFQASSLEQRSDPSITIPLNRARADMAELIDVQSVMERNPGLQSRITNKQLDDIQSNLRYLRSMLYDLEASGAIQPTALEGFVSYETYPKAPAEGFADVNQNDEIVTKLKEMIASWTKVKHLTSAPKATTEATSGISRMTNLMDMYINGTASFTPDELLEEQVRIKTAINDSTTRLQMIIKEFNLDLNPASTIDLQPKPQAPMPSSTLPEPTTQVESTEQRASLKELQEFQIKVVVEIQRLNASGTSDPVIQGRLNVLNRIKDEVDDVITKLQNGFYTPNTVPIYKSDIEKALPILGNPSSPLPQVLRENNLPPAIASLFPGGLSPKDNEQAAQITNVVKGYMKNLFEGASWGINLNFKYDNPNIAKLQAKAASIEKPMPLQGPAPTTGIPGIQPGSRLEGGSVRDSVLTPSPNGLYRTTDSYDYGLPGSSIQREFPPLKSGGLDWKAKAQEIREQIRRRGLNPTQFGALPVDAQVSEEFSWRGYTQMLCSRLKTTSDPGLPVTVGCPPDNWAGWKD